VSLLDAGSDVTMELDQSDLECCVEMRVFDRARDEGTQGRVNGENNRLHDTRRKKTKVTRNAGY